MKVETSDHTGTRYNVMVEILGGPGSYADVVEIRGEKYWIAVSPDGIEFSRPEHGPHYILDGPNGLECSCHSFFHRPGPCKHVIFVVEHGYLPIGWEVPDLATINPPREPQFSATTL